MFDTALAYLKNYRDRRVKALNNEEPQRWFASGVSSLAEIYDSKFDSGTENAAWTALATAPKPQFSKLQAIRLKIAFLAGCRHDLRSHFAIGRGHQPKTAIDFDRHARSEIDGATYSLEHFKQVVETKEAGV